MNFDHIKNRAKIFKKDDTIIVYVHSRMTGTLYDIQHRLRVRSALFGYMFTSYHQDMDFTLALSKGWVEIN